MPKANETEIKRAAIDFECLTYTVKQVAGMLGVCDKTLYEQIRLNKIPGKIIVGRKIVFARKIIDEWIANPS